MWKPKKVSLRLLFQQQVNFRLKIPQDITGPDFTQSRQIRAADIKITDLVPEGTQVKAGDYIATLDRTSFDNTLKDELERLTTQETNLEVKMLDTAVTLSDLAR